MKSVGFIGLGNMGMGMAKNILQKGLELTVYDIRKEPLKELAQLGAQIAKFPREVGERSDVVFVMVLDGAQVKEVVLGKRGLLEGMKPGSTIICTATIMRSEMIEVANAVTKKGIKIIDSPVSGGAPGAAAGTLTMMVAAKKDVFESSKGVLQTVGKDIYHVGEEPGMGQTVKAALEAIVGASFTAIFEALVLGAKAGVKPEVLYQVISTSMVGSALFRYTAKHIMERHFKGGGACIQVMYKDLGITMNMAKECGVPMFTTSAAYELFQAGKSLNPEEDTWTIIKILENIAGVEVKKTT